MRGKLRKILVISIVALSLVLLLYYLLTVSLYSLMQDTGLPRLDVVTEDGAKIKSKEEYVDCTVSLSGADDDAYNFENAEAGIRGRGNDTWLYYPKKPYRIKFSEKTSVFGEAKNKSWVLLAMYNDFSLSKDRLAFFLADKIGTENFVPSYNYVELYLNGKYKGIYLLTDQVDENSGRCEVKEDFSEESREVPFLVELDARAPEEGKEGIDWFAVGNKYYAVKYPEADERYTDLQFEYIKGYIETVDALVRREGVTLTEISEYIDVRAFTDYYVIEELMGQPEINWKSVYMSKKIDGVLVMGPLWDFDWAARGPSVGSNRNAYKKATEGFRGVDNWFVSLYNSSPEYRGFVCERWREIRPDIEDALVEFSAGRDTILKAARKNHFKWYFYSPIVFYKSEFNKTLDWIEMRILWLDEEFLYTD